MKEPNFSDLSPRPNPLSPFPEREGGTPLPVSGRGWGRGLPLGVALLAIIILGALWAWNQSSVRYEESAGPIKVSPAKTKIQGDPDDFVTTVFVLRNLSEQERSYELHVEAPQGWNILNGLEAVTIGPQAQHEVFLTVQIPPGTPAQEYWLALRAQSDEFWALGRAQIVVRAQERLKLALPFSDLIVHPNEEKTLSLTVTNRGNIAARVSLAVTVAPVGWQFRLRDSSFTLDPTQSKTVELTVKPLSEALVAPARFTVQATAGSARDNTKVTKEIIVAAKNLKVIGRAGTGLDNIDVEAAQRANIIVLNAPGANATAVAELTVGLMIALARDLPSAVSAAASGKKVKSYGTELAGKTLA
jgi:hypothetical protein